MVHLLGSTIVTYDNLLYACHTCNLLKGKKDLPDPSQVLTAEAARVNPDGGIEGRSPDAQAYRDSWP